MLKSPLFPLALLAALGCSSSSTSHLVDSGAPPKDSGTADHATAHDSGYDAGETTADSGAGDTGFDAGPPPTPTGITLAAGHDIAIQGVTDDGYVIYRTDTTVSAVSLAGLPDAGAMPVVIAQLGDAGAGSEFAVVSHDDVFVWSNLVDGPVGNLALWSHSLGAAAPLSTASVAGLAAASADSSAIVFTTGAASGGATASLVGATTSMLAAPVTLATNLDTDGQTCQASFRFTGSVSPFTAVASFCIVGDGGYGPESVYAYSSASWAPGRNLATGATAFSLDTTGTSAAVALASGQLEIAPLSGGAAIPIDSSGTLGMTSTAYLSKTDAFVLYNTGGGALKTSTVTASAPQTLTGSNVNGIDAVSTSEAWAIVHDGVDMATLLPSDLSLASTGVAGTPVALTSGTTVAAILGDAFTADSSYAIYMTGVTVDAQSNGVGTLNAAAVATPGTVVRLATAAVNDTDFSPSDLALTGTKIVFTDNFNANRSSTGTVDLRVVDLASATPASTIMSGADPGYFVSFDKQWVVYTITFGGPTDGLYAVAP